MLKSILSVLLLSLLFGCLATPVPPSDRVNPTTNATHVIDLTVRDEIRGTGVTLKADGPLTYQVFQKNDPPRILLTFSGIKLNPAIQPRLVNLSTIVGLFPGETPDHNGQLELTLPDLLEYDIKENPTGLELTVLAKKQSAATSPPEIRDARISAVQSGTEIRFMGTGLVPDPKIFRTEEPPRMVVDLLGIAGPKASRTIAAGTQETTSAQLVGAPGKTRMIVDLTSPDITYRVTRDKESPVIHLTRRPTLAENPPSVTGVSFSRAGEDALTRIQLNREGSVAHSQRQGNTLTLLLKKTVAAPQWIRRMDVREFGGPVEYVDLQPKDDNLLATLHLSKEAGQHDILQKEQEILIRVKPGVEHNQSGQDDFNFSGQKVSLDVKEIDIQNALRFMAEIVKINIILADTVTGTLTMRITDVPWDQALDLMLAAKQLGKIKQGNVLRIAPLTEIQKMTEARIADQNTKRQLEPMVTEMIPVNFAKSEKIKNLLLEGDQAKGNSIISSQGSVSLDERTNTLIVKDSASNLTQIRKMIKNLDQPTPQVLIEARIVEVERSESEKLGINWGFNLGRNAKLGISDSVRNAYYTKMSATSVLDKAKDFTYNEGVALYDASTGWGRPR
ncbi:MAG: AMIN domain-containing protein, partial [Magnetococcales bacterium]|nr:AMIN domain-containing protein [Magnetococcales bacterium]